MATNPNPYLGFRESNPWLGNLLSGAGYTLTGLASNTPASWAYAQQGIQNYAQNQFQNRRETAQDAQAKQLFDLQMQDRADRQAKDAAHQAMVAKLFAGVPGQANNGRPGGMGTPAQPGMLGFTPQQQQAAMALGPEQQDALIAQQTFPPPEKKQQPMNVGGLIIDPNDPSHPLADYSSVIQANSAAGKSSNTVVLPKVETEYQKSYGGEQGKSAAAIPEEANTARNQLDQLNIITELRRQAQEAGDDVSALAPVKAKLGAYMQSIGLDPQQYDMGPTGIFQAIGAASNKLALSGIGKGGLPANNFSEADRDFITSTVPGLDNTPQGADLKALVAQKTAMRGIEKENMWNNGQYDHTTEAGYDKFIRDWSKYVQSHPLFDDHIRATAKLLKPSKTSPIRQQPAAPAAAPMIVPTLNPADGWQ